MFRRDPRKQYFTKYTDGNTASDGTYNFAVLLPLNEVDFTQRHIIITTLSIIMKSSADVLELCMVNSDDTPSNIEDLGPSFFIPVRTLVYGGNLRYRGILIRDGFPYIPAIKAAGGGPFISFIEYHYEPGPV